MPQFRARVDYVTYTDIVLVFEADSIEEAEAAIWRGLDDAEIESWGEGVTEVDGVQSIEEVIEDE